MTIVIFQNVVQYGMIKTMISEKISVTIGDYLITIFTLERDGEPATGVRLAELLNVTPPTVTNTLKRMVRDGLVVMNSAHLPYLTEAGFEAASSIMRRHMLAEWMLNRLLSWSKLHKEAHEFEHAISSEVEAALLEELHHPHLCPHGNPFPGYEDAASSWIPLTQTCSGARGIVRRIHEFAEDNTDILTFLEENQIAPGQHVQIEQVLPFNETITITVDRHFVPLGFAVARYIFVELV